MSFFESLLVLLLIAIFLLQISRRLAVPYPSMLALAGAAVALVPGMPIISLDPATALALFIAPALLDAAFDFPIGIARRFWLPLCVFAIGGVVVTAGVVAWVGWAFAGLPIAAALVMGAIVAPPDAAAATAVLSSMAIPRNTDTILRGESLFNDAAALLIFDAALAIQMAGTLDTPVALHLTMAVPGGILFGVAAAFIVRPLTKFVSGTLGGNLLQFVQTFLIWIIAERLELSAVLAIVAFAMTIARMTTDSQFSVRMRVQSYAVWSAVVFVLNVMAFLLMGMQVRDIVGGMPADHLGTAAMFALVVVVIVVAVRFTVCVGFNRAHAWVERQRGRPEPATMKQALLASWCGMRGLVTLATSLALPMDFPQRDLVVLTAFAVVLATLVLQGLTLTPIIRWLGLDRRADGPHELAGFRSRIAAAGMDTLDQAEGREADVLRSKFQIERRAFEDEASAASLENYRRLTLSAIAAQRQKLEELRIAHEINVDEYNLLLEEIDWRELSVLPDTARRIEEI